MSTKFTFTYLYIILLMWGVMNFAQAVQIGNDGTVIVDTPYGQEITRPGEQPTYIYKTPYGKQINEPKGVDRYPEHIYDMRPLSDPYGDPYQRY